MNGQITKNPKCPACGSGELITRQGKYGEFIGCSNYPECNYILKNKHMTKSIKEPQVEFLGPKQYKPLGNPRFDSQSAYVSYSKDLLIASLQFQIELLKAGVIKNIDGLSDIGTLTNQAEQCIKALKKAFEQ